MRCIRLRGGHHRSGGGRGVGCWGRKSCAGKAGRSIGTLQNRPAQTTPGSRKRSAYSCGRHCSGPRSAQQHTVTSAHRLEVALTDDAVPAREPPVAGVARVQLIRVAAKADVIGDARGALERDNDAEDSAKDLNSGRAPPFGSGAGGIHACAHVLHGHGTQRETCGARLPPCGVISMARRLPRGAWFAP